MGSDIERKICFDVRRLLSRKPKPRNVSQGEYQ
jgi:hypothetical protein